MAEPLEGEIVSGGLPVPGPGRDSKYRVEFNEQARKLCLLGAIDREIAAFFGISESTLNDWKRRYPAFSESIKAGKVIADAEVADSLYRRATGENIIVERAVKKEDGSYEAMKLTQFVPGEVAAQRLWLLNRRNPDWRDKHEVEHGGRVAHVVDEAATAAALERIDQLIAALAGRGAPSEGGPVSG